MGTQSFKANDPVEKKVQDAFFPLLDTLSDDKDDFFDGANECFKLGEVLFDLGADPLADSIERAVFIEIFSVLHQGFKVAGTFEFYLDVFRAVWGPAIDIEFVIPSPGVLEINIAGFDTIVYDALARRIVSNAYVFDEIMDQDGNNLAFQDLVGIKSQAETDALLDEIKPAGVFVQATLTT